MGKSRNRFRSFAVWATSLLSIACFSGCGLLGEKDERSDLLSLSGSGCLNEMGPLITTYLEGTVDAGKWDQMWKCVDDSLTLFTRYVKGEGENGSGYSQSDIRLLISRFFLTETEVRPEFVRVLFELKQTLFGGDANILRLEEIARFRSLADFLRKESKALIPHFKNRNSNPTSDQLLAFNEALGSFGRKAGNALAEGNGEFSAESATLFLNEFVRMSKLVPSAFTLEVGSYVRFALEIKALLLKTDARAIPASEWPKLLTLGGEIGAVAWTYLSSRNATPSFSLELSTRARRALDSTLSLWGAIPYLEIKRVLAAVPASLLPAENYREGFIQSLRPVFTTVLQGTSSEALEARALDKALELYQRGVRTQMHLEKIYALLPASSVSAAQFAATADQYAERAALGQADLKEITRLKKIATVHPGLYPESRSPFAGEIIFDEQTRHTENNLARLSWLEIISRQLLDTYGHVCSGGECAGSLADLQTLVRDFSPLLDTLGKVHPLVCDVDKKRFREANTFMPSSNGNRDLDVREVTEYLAFLLSANAQSQRVQKALFESAAPGLPPVCPPLLDANGAPRLDPHLGIPLYDIQCFRENYFARIDEFWAQYPKLLSHYRTLPANRRTGLQASIETSARRLGYNQDPISTYDVDGFPGIEQYIESVMKKFDRRVEPTSPPDTLSRTEILSDAYPVFRNAIFDLAESEEFNGLATGFKDAIGKVMILYLAQEGRLPFEELTSPTLSEIWDLIGWLFSGGPFQDFSADRARLYDVFAGLGAATATASCEAPIPESTGFDQVIRWIPGGL